MLRGEYLDSWIELNLHMDMDPFWTPGLVLDSKS